MRFDRRSSVAGVALIGVALLMLVDPLGVRSAVASWIRVTESANGSARAVVATLSDRIDRIASLSDALAADPTLSIALFAVGAGIGLVVGSVLAYRRQRRRLRKGDRDA